MTVDEIKASNKQEVKAPTSVHDMTTHLKMFTITNDIFFVTLSVGSQCLRSLQSMIDRHRSSFKAREHLNEEFASKFLLAVDTRIQMWLKQCRSAENRSNVDDSIINFSHLVSQVLFGSFHITLPPILKMKAPTEESAQSTGGVKRDGAARNGDKGRRKKKKNGEEREKAMMKNKAPHSKLGMLTSKTWAINFASKNIDSRPKCERKVHNVPPMAHPQVLLQRSATASTRKATSKRMKSQPKSST